MIGNNFVAWLITFGLAVGWLRFMDFLAAKKVISGPVSRKIIHIGTGPLFVVCWLLFDDALYARYLAATIPLLTTLQFALVGFGVIKDEAAVQAMSRTGRREEILKGPMIYGIVFVVLTIIYWKDSPIGIVALMILCGGDGIADIVGKRWKSSSLVWSPRKTIFGSLSMFFGGFILSSLILWFFSILAPTSVLWVSQLGSVLIIAIAATFVESLPIGDFDNLTVPIISVVLGHLLFI